MAPASDPRTRPTCFTYSPWWSAHPEPVSICLEGYDTADKIAYVIRTQRTFWELDQLEYVAMVGPVGGIYLDVGSNIGNHAVFFARFCADHVVAVEPNPRLHAILQRNLDANAVGRRCTIVPIGISASDTTGTMSLRDEHRGNIGASHIVAGAATSRDADVIALRRLDDLLEELASSLPPAPGTFLKIDVEGMEMDVLRSATALLRGHRPQILVELATDEALTEAAAWLGDFGYEPVARISSPPSYHFIVPGRHALRANKWHGGNYYANALYMAEQELASVTAGDAVVIVADLDEAGLVSSIAGRMRLPFVENGGQYFGPPAHDDHAIAELARLRERGGTHFAVLWPAFWFFNAYPGFARHLRQYPTLLQNERLIVFSLHD